jgi:hypothetical protein
MFLMGRSVHGIIAIMWKDRFDDQECTHLAGIRGVDTWSACAALERVRV